MTENHPATEDAGNDPLRHHHKARRLIWLGGAGVAVLVAITVYVNLGQSLVIERTDPVGWMDPAREIAQAAAEQGIYAKQTSSPLSPGRIGNYHPDVFRFEANFGLRNGAVRRLSADIDRELFVNMLRGTNAEKAIDY